MADFPLACSFQGDYGYKVLVVDDEDTIGRVIEKAVEQITGVLVAPIPDDAVLKLQVQGADEPLADDLRVKDAGLVAMESIEIYRAD